MAGRYFGGAARIHIGVDHGREILTFRTVALLDPDQEGNVRPWEVQLRIDAGELARMLGCQAIQKGNKSAALPANRVRATILKPYVEEDHERPKKPHGNFLESPGGKWVAPTPEEGDGKDGE